MDRFYVGTLNGVLGIGDREVPNEFAAWGDADYWFDEVHAKAEKLNAHPEERYRVFWDTI